MDEWGSTRGNFRIVTHSGCGPQYTYHPSSVDILNTSETLLYQAFAAVEYQSLCSVNKPFEMSGFPSLTPAFTVRVTIDAPMPVGGQGGSSLVIVPMVGGTIKSEEGVEPKLDAEL